VRFVFILGIQISQNHALIPSGKFRRVLLCSSNTGYPLRFIKCHHWVRRPRFPLPDAFLNLLYSAILASYLLEEELGHLGRLGCTICLLGSLIIVLHAPADKDIQTVDEVLRYAVQPGASSSLPLHVIMYLTR